MPVQRLEQTFRLLRIGVIVASAILSGLCGWAAGALHSETYQGDSRSIFTDLFFVAAGIVFGALAGVGAGLLWSRTLRRATLKSIERSGRVSPLLILYGVGMGLAVGIAATVALHAALTVLTLQWKHIMFALVGQVFGVPAGLGLGLVCGVVWWGVAQALCGHRAGQAVTPRG
jgi:hypothetical protein